MLIPIVKIQVQIDGDEKQVAFDLGKEENLDNIASKFETQSQLV